MNDPNGGAVAVMGPTDLEFAETGFVYIQMLLDQIYVSGVRTLGEAMFRVAGKAPFGAGRVDLTFQGTMLFGDPALPMSPPARVAPPPTVVMTDRLDGAGGFSATDLASRVAPRAGRRPVAGSDALAGSMSAPLLSELQRAPVFALEGASPNPAVGGALTVAFSLKGAEPAELELIDVSGRRVATQEVGSLGPGRHVLNLAEGLRIQPGIYIVRLTEAGHSLTQRVAALR